MVRHSVECEVRYIFNGRHHFCCTLMYSYGCTFIFSVQLPDGTISDLYPVDDNYVVTKNQHRSPKSLKELCIDVVCRSLPDLDGELPPGIPEDIVQSIVKSLVDHAALNGTTLRALRNCELGKLSLAGCRGVRDDWLQIFSSDGEHFNSSINTPTSAYDMKDINDTMETSNLKETVDDHNSPQLNRLQLLENDSVSSHSTSSFVTAHSSPCSAAPSVQVAVDENQMKCKREQEYFSSISQASNYDNENSEMQEFLLHEQNINADLSYQINPGTTFGAPSIASTLTLLDLCGSKRVTDRGLLQLHNLTALEIVKMDNCHSITGRGLVAFSNSHRLHTLSLVNCRRLTDEAIINISHLSSSLEALVLEGCRCLTDRSLIAISNLSSLSKLDLSLCDLITNKALQFLHPLEFLEELYLGWCRNIGDEGLEILCSQPGRKENLKVLRLARCPITNETCSSLPKLSALKELDLNGCNKLKSDKLGWALELLKNLTVLDVSYCPGIL